MSLNPIPTLHLETFDDYIEYLLKYHPDKTEVDEAQVLIIEAATISSKDRAQQFNNLAFRKYATLFHEYVAICYSVGILALVGEYGRYMEYFESNN